jgi:hypothetical protein
MSWSRRFVDPIPTKGKPLVTLQDAAQFILKLSKAEQSKPHSLAAAEAVILAAEDRGPLMQTIATELTEEQLGNVSGGNDLITAFQQGFEKGKTEPLAPPPTPSGGKCSGCRWIEVIS